MRIKFFTVSLAMAMLATVTPSHAQVAEDEIQEAVEVIKGLSIDKTPEWAIGILKQVTDTAKLPQVNNTLAMAYLNGIGVDKDSIAAIKYFEDAAHRGYTNAYNNLGMIMKNAAYGKQDFKKAVYYFEEGVKAGSLMCNYDAGYMYYKGLGCKQDYARAIEFFKRGIASNNPSCLYMLGLCYRNGYGVEANEANASDCLKKASMANYRFAIEETLRENAEVLPSMSISEDAIPESMPAAETFLDKSNDLTGQYKGLLVTYDWSGQQVVKEQKLNISFNKAQGCYYGKWIQDADTLVFSAEIADDGTLKFNNTQMLMNDRYTEGEKVDYMFEDASLVLLNHSLSGSLRLYSTTQKEPQRPMYLSLNKSTSKIEYADKNNCDISAYPVAGTNQLEVRFVLPGDVKDASIYLTMQNGMPAKSFKLGPLQAGDQRFTIPTNLNNGVYAVTLKADNRHGQTLMMLKR
jgi:TPR repeat protein